MTAASSSTATERPQLVDLCGEGHVAMEASQQLGTVAKR